MTVTRTDAVRPNLDSTSKDEASEYDRFADLAKRLVKVPKKELDEARKRDELDRA